MRVAALGEIEIGATGQKLTGLRELALFERHPTQIVEGNSQIRVIGTENLLVDREGLAPILLRGRRVSLKVSCAPKVVEVVRDFGVKASIDRQTEFQCSDIL